MWYLGLRGAAPVAPERDFQSVGFTPEHSTRTRTSPRPGSGFSTSSTDNTSDEPISR